MCYVYVPLSRSLKWLFIFQNLDYYKSESNYGHIYFRFLQQMLGIYSWTHTVIMKIGFLEWLSNKIASFIQNITFITFIFYLNKNTCKFHEFENKNPNVNVSVSSHLGFSNSFKSCIQFQMASIVKPTIFINLVTSV